MEYFKEGKFQTWLEDRFYDDEAETISEIDEDNSNLSTKIFLTLGVECDDDLDFIKRVREKKSILNEKTDEESIIENAMTTEFMLSRQVQRIRYCLYDD